ncbi:ABC transporter ATP-binding protein [Microvirga pudoricolor]|uniref:ABC transporter ATP-binding protein n=1 Tax=Microvirga pudoricolor TaxID=2778729 RepID=UPI001E46C2E3|nr:ABC transporter ATP-binding protein [Microvirga pudoricolor]
MSALLDVRDLHTRFRTPSSVINAVNGVSFSVQPGETLAIVGESGSGKSVSMLSIQGLLPPHGGAVEGGKALFQGIDLLQLDKKEMRKINGAKIGMIFQDPMSSLNPVLTIGYQISEALREHEMLSRGEARRRAIDLLRLVGIPMAENRLNDYPHQFSGGMRQRAMIAMALSCNPALLIADEPTTALDVTIQAQILRLVRRLRAERGMALIWITHDLGVVSRIADRVMVMYAGSVVEEAGVLDFYATPRHPYSRGLLSSLPRLDDNVGEQLRPISGQPPDLSKLKAGCPFAPRCPYTIERCVRETPSLVPTGSDPRARVACWRANEIGAYHEQ